MALIADDMRLGKTHCTLAMLLYLKYISNQAAASTALSWLDGKSVSQLEQVPRIFDPDNVMYRRPSIIIVPANLVSAWEPAL